MNMGEPLSNKPIKKIKIKKGKKINKPMNENIKSKILIISLESFLSQLLQEELEFSC